MTSDGMELETHQSPRYCFLGRLAFYLVCRITEGESSAKMPFLVNIFGQRGQDCSDPVLNQPRKSQAGQDWIIRGPLKRFLKIFLGVARDLCAIKPPG